MCKSTAQWYEILSEIAGFSQILVHADIQGTTPFVLGSFESLESLEDHIRK